MLREPSQLDRALGAEIQLDVLRAHLERLKAAHRLESLAMAQLWEASPLGFVLLDMKGDITRINQKFASWLQQNRELCLGQSLSDLTAAAPFGRSLWRSLAGETASCQWSPDREEHRLLLSHFYPISDDTGSIAHVMCLTIDETQAVCQERERDASFRFREYSREPYVRCDEWGHFVEWNPAFAQLLDEAELSLTQSTLASVIEPCDRRLVSPVLTDGVDEPPYEVNLRIANARDHYSWRFWSLELTSGFCAAAVPLVRPSDFGSVGIVGSLPGGLVGALSDRFRIAGSVVHPFSGLTDTLSYLYNHPGQLELLVVDARDVDRLGQTTTSPLPDLISFYRTVEDRVKAIEAGALVALPEPQSIAELDRALEEALTQYLRTERS